MDTSDTPDLLFRNTSLRIRLRFTPAMACSTRTRTRASLRLARFSASVNARPRGFFFRLAGPRDRRLVPLKTGVLVQDGPGRVLQVRLVGDALVMGLAGVRPAEEQDALIGAADQQHVLVGMGLLLAAVVQRLFLGLCRRLPPPLRAVKDDQRRPANAGPRSAQPAPSALRQEPQVVQGRAQDGEQVMQPIVRLGGTEVKELPEYDLERIGFQVDEEEEQLSRLLRERTGPTGARPALARSPRGGSIHRVGAVVGPLEGRQQLAKLGVG